MNHHLIPQVIRQELVAPHELHLGAMASGGLSSAWIWKCQSPHGPVALRGWPTMHPTAERLSRIHSAMRVARQQGMESIPAIFGNRQGKSFTSDGQRLWELTQWMPGAADYPQAPSTQRLQFALQSLAKLHVAWHAAGESVVPNPWLNCSSPAVLPARELEEPVVGLSPTVAERRQKLEHSLQRQQAWRSCVLADSSPSSFMAAGSTLGNSSFGDSMLGGSALGASALGASQSRAAAKTALAHQTLMHLAALGPELLKAMIEIQSTPVRLHFVLRDVWSDHILFTGARVTGIVDFGAARIDEPATDVARLLGSLEPLNASRWLIGWQAYHADNPHVDLERVRLLDRIGTLLAAVQWLQWLVIEPRQFDVPTEQLLVRWQRLLQRLEASV